MEKYIERPILIHGCKFHLRAFALSVTDGGFYVHENYFALISSYKYSLLDLDDPVTHFTNNSVQRAVENYNGDHCRLPRDAFEAQLVTEGASQAQGQRQAQGPSQGRYCPFF